MADDNDNYTETVRTSWLGNISNSFTNAGIGILLFIGSFFLLWWNEGSSVARLKTLDAGLSNVLAVSSERVDPANNGKLIHLSGTATTNARLSDPYFGVSETALKLKRRVEMYQWKETSESTTNKEVGGQSTTETTYTYSKVWSDELIDSSSFKRPQGHRNPPTLPFRSETFTAPDIKINDFNLSKAFTGQIIEFTDYPLSQQHFSAADSAIQQAFTLSNGRYFQGNNPSNPQIGAVRVSYTIIGPSEVSVVGQQNDSNLDSHFTKNGELALLEIGRVSAEKMFANAKSENTLWTWLLRLGGIAMMWIGLVMVFSPLRAVADVVPFLGTILGAGIGIVAGVVAIALSIITIALAWLYYRPLIGIIMLILAGMFIFGGFRAIKQRIENRLYTS